MTFAGCFEGAIAQTDEDMRSYSTVSGTASSMMGSETGWSAEPHASWQFLRQWMQLDLGEVVLVAGTVAQGRGVHDQYVSKYVVKRSVDGSNWLDVPGQFSVAVNGTTENLFARALYTQHIRLIVLEWEGYISMRADALLCYGSRAPTTAPTRGV